jgi:hypothetical protein
MSARTWSGFQPLFYLAGLFGRSRFASAAAGIINAIKSIRPAELLNGPN